VTDLTIRPTAKFLIARFIATGVVFVAIEIWYATSLRDKGVPGFFPFAVLIIFFPVLLRFIQRQLTAVKLSGDRLKYETGFMSKTTRTMQLSRLQDVRVEQRPLQRMFNVGDISIETAGENSRLTIPNVDSPHELADEVLNRAQALQNPRPSQQ